MAEKGTLINKSSLSFQVKVFQCKALGIWCGACFSTIPSGINLYMGVLLMTSYLPELMRKDQPELMLHSKSKESKSDSQVHSNEHDHSPPSPFTSQNS